MSNLRNQLDDAKAEYRSAKYGGDLAAELLKERRAAGDRPSMRLRWILPLLTGAIAALVALVLWWPRPVSKPPVVILPAPQPAVRPIDWESTMTGLPSMPVGRVVSDMGTGMREAVAQIGQNVNGALDAPVITGGVATMRHVAGELQEFASVTWDQLRPRTGP